MSERPGGRPLDEDNDERSNGDGVSGEPVIPGTELAAAALEYARRGLPVLPVHSVDVERRCTCGDANCSSPAKHPRTAHGLTDASSDPDVVREWWTQWPDSNIGVRTGAVADIVVLDVDAQHGGARTLKELEQGHGALPATAQALTGGGGYHLFFRHPGHEVRNSAGRLGPGIDVRADQGFVIVPPSVHRTGRVYKWTRPLATTVLADMPGWLAGGGRERTNGAATSVGDAIPEGQRNATLASLAGTMRRRGMGEGEIRAALVVANRERCRPPLSDDEVSSIAVSVAGYAPEQAPPAADPMSPASATSTDPGPFQLVPLDWGPIVTQGVPEVEYVLAPYVPARKRIWAVGPGEAGKSIYAAHLAAKLTRGGKIVVYVSQENGLEEEVRRFLRLRAGFENLRLFVDQDLDLAVASHVGALIEASGPKRLPARHAHDANGLLTNALERAVTKKHRGRAKPPVIGGFAFCLLLVGTCCHGAPRTSSSELRASFERETARQAECVRLCSLKLRHVQTVPLVIRITRARARHRTEGGTHLSGYTIVNLKEIDNGAVEGGSTLEARFARSHIDSDHIGVSHFRYAPDRRSSKGHSHKEQEEVYVVLGGSGRVKLDDELFDLRQWDVIRVAPTTFRGFAAGPDGLELLAVGSDRPEGGDGVMADDDWWGD